MLESVLGLATSFRPRLDLPIEFKDEAVEEDEIAQARLDFKNRLRPLAAKTSIFAE